MKITRRTFLVSTAAISALSMSHLGVSVKAAPLSDYAKIFKLCYDAHMNIAIDTGNDNPIDYENMARELIAGRPIDKSNSVRHRNKIIDTLETLNLSYSIVATNALDRWDFEIPTTSGPLYSNIFDGVNVIILEDFAKAMPIVQTLILQHISTNWRKPKDHQPMFVITAATTDKIYQRFHLYNPMFNFVAFPTQEV